MKKILFSIIVLCVISCNSGGDTDHERSTKTVDEQINNTPATEQNIGDTTPTTNNNIYNPDSPAGKGTSYDTSAR